MFPHEREGASVVGGEGRYNKATVKRLQNKWRFICAKKSLTQLTHCAAAYS